MPSDPEIEACSRWMDREIEILRPTLVIPVGKLAISRFVQVERLDTCIGRVFEVERKLGAGSEPSRFEVVPLPHPSGASPWHRMEPGKTLLGQAMAEISRRLVR